MRYLLGIPLAMWLAISASVAIGQTDQAAPEKYSQFDRAQSINRDVSFQSASEVVPGKSSTRVNLLVRETVSLLDGEEVRHRSYNGSLVGPTIRVNPGQELHVRVRNMLRPLPDSHESANEPHGFNTTNLHTHGLHVSPTFPEDDVFHEIKPGETDDYVFKIPPGHHPGTFWYHAHKHGSTALQLASGMAGALIVNGGLDTAPVVKDAAEKILVIQQFTVKQSPGEIGFIDADSIYADGEADFVEAINGVVTPTIVMRPGEIQRWRIIHAGTTEVVNLDIEGISFHEIAVDGLATGSIETLNKLKLYPGYRSDVLVRAPDAEVERLMTSKIDNADQSLRQVITERRNLLRIVVAGEPKPMTLPTEEQLAPFAAYSQDDVPQEWSNTRRIEFDMEGDTKFFINGKQFDAKTIDQTIDLNTTEQWEIVSKRGVHPFHIHVNPFACREKDSDDRWVWRDTIAVRPRKPMILRTTYEDFIGKTVLHCHNLKHEDLGMMQSIEIVDTKPESLADSKSESLPLAPEWSAKKMNGESVSQSEYEDQTVLVVFHRGMNCYHCAQQLILLKKHLQKLESANISVVAISQYLPDEAESRAKIANFGYPVLVDEELESFQQFDCIGSEGVPLHGLFLINSENRIVFQEKSEVAVTDPDQLIDRLIKLLN